jgi:ABC-type sugar transport system ATPase subunit
MWKSKIVAAMPVRTWRLPMNAAPAHALAEPLLTVRGIRKSFGGVEVLKGVGFEVRAGEVHALIGENGAGKSTLMNIVAGVLRPDAGEIRLCGRSVPGFASAHAAQLAGVGMVFQERSLFGPLTAAENIFAGRQPVTRWGAIDRRRLSTDTERLLAEVAPEVKPTDVLDELTPARQQMVEIAKALSLDARVLVFDEPTAALTEMETTRLFAVIRRLRERGAGIIYITHRLEEVFALADRVTVLKDGVGQGTCLTAETNPTDLIRRMVGRDVEAPSGAADTSSNPLLIEVDNLRDKIADRPGPRLRGVSLRVRAGEIVGLAGLAGSGRTETALALFGARPGACGDVRLAGRAATIRSPQEAIDAGLGYVSEDRKESGLFLEMSLRRNISAARLGRFGNWFYRDGDEARLAEDYRRRLRIVCQSVEQDTGHLSGGNQQKVLLARWLLVNPRVLIVDEPTRGVDVGAKAEVHQLLREFAGRGSGVLMISSDLPEVLAVSDRIYVMRAGCVAGELSREKAGEEAIMRLAAGGQTQ